VTDLLLLRHAQSTWNAEGRWQGSADPPLSQRGVVEAVDAAEMIAAARRAGTPALGEVVAMASSDLSRARETADILADRLALPGVALFRGLRERDVGEFTGLTRVEIESRWPGLLARVPLDPPGGESLAALLARAVATLHRIAQAHPAEAVVVVTHGALIRTVEAHLGVLQPGPPRNLNGRWVSLDGGQLTPGPPVSLRPDDEPAPVADAVAS
jgi:probable phosphoglycerate mutase